MTNSKRFGESRICRGALLAAMTVVFLMVSIGVSTIVSHAQEGTVTGQSVNVRSEASSSSDILASVVKGDKIDIIGSVTGADGYTWYQIYIDASKKGYVRSDFVSTSGSVSALPNNSETTTTETSTSTGDTVTTEGVNAVNPVSATVSGGQSVRVRADASTSSSIVTTVENGLALTVTGTKTGLDGNVWYLSEFIKNNASVVGYIRSDFVTLEGELTAPVEETAETTETTEEPTAPVESAPVQNKVWDTQEREDGWYLLNMEDGVQYNIQEIFNKNDANIALYEAEHKKAKTLRVVLIIFIIVAIAAVGGAAFFYLKWREITDKIAFEEAERNRRARQAQRTGRPGPGGARPAQGQGQRPAQGQKPGNGQRPAPGQGQRPANGQRPEGGQGQRPAGANGQRPQGQRPVNGQRPAQERPVRTEQPANENVPDLENEVEQETRNVVRDSASEAAVKTQNEQNKKWKSKNFTDDDDEFEFGFLNWDEDDKK
jgi:uncharacterized protein YgiM (DUF1202 family)